MANNAMEVSPPEELRNPLVVPHKVLMGAGPSNVSPRVLHALSQPVLGPIHPELFKIMDEIKKGIQYIFQTKNELTLVVSASGHAGMETALCNLLEPGDKVLIVVNGLWGERATIMAKRYGGVVTRLEKPTTSDNFSFDEIEKAVKNTTPKLLFVVQGESSAGIYQPLEKIGTITRKYNCLLVVDAVASVGSVPLFMDAWNIDVLYSGSQKILGVPPGLAPISFSRQAQDVIFNRKSPISVYYWDVTLLGKQWNCFEKKLPRPIYYHHTPSANLLYGLREALAVIAEEGLEQSIQRHKKCAALFYKGIERLGLDFYVEDESKRLPSITTIKVPANVDWGDVAGYAMENYGLEMSGQVIPSTGKVFRIGIMGYNATPERVNLTLRVLEEALEHCRKK